MYTDTEILAYRAYHVRLIARADVGFMRGQQRFVVTAVLPAPPLPGLPRLGPWQPDPEAPHAFMRCVIGG